MKRFLSPLQAFDFVLTTAVGPVTVLIDYPGDGTRHDRPKQGAYLATWGGVRDQRHVFCRMVDCGFSWVRPLPKGSRA